MQNVFCYLKVSIFHLCLHVVDKKQTCAILLDNIMLNKFDPFCMHWSCSPSTGHASAKRDQEHSWSNYYVRTKNIGGAWGKFDSFTFSLYAY